MKNQITVFVEDSLYGKSALAHAQKLALIFDTEVQTVDLHKKTDLNLFFSNKVDNTLCIVLPVGQLKKHSFFNVKNARKWIMRSRVPVLTVGKKVPEENDYQQIILPLDINCQEKELALWASYFPAYFQKNCPHIYRENMLIHVVFNQYKDAFLRQKVQNNIEFAKKMFDNLEAPYTLHPFTNVDNIHTFGLQFAKERAHAVLLYLMPEHNSLIDFIFGHVSNKLLGNMEQIPVLCLNTRDDIFVLCR
jgi:hypothetical protein